MNANELAKLLEVDSWYKLVTREEIATMLRQQQAELNAFKLQYYNTGYNIQLRDKDETIRQQQAEIEALKGGFFDWSGFKKLTDEEIKQIFQEQTGFYFDDNPADDLALMDFAKAILRKAQER